MKTMELQSPNHTGVSRPLKHDGPPVKKRHTMKADTLQEELRLDAKTDMADARLYVEAQRAELSHRGYAPAPDLEPVPYDSVEQYFAARQEVTGQEATLDFDALCRQRASTKEKTVDAILAKIQEADNAIVYDAGLREGFRGQMHKRFAGDHFLSNVDLIEQTSLLDVASHMPKGAHLHIHFNACLPPQVLINIAKDMKRMFITSDLPLTSDNNFASFDKCEIQFTIASTGNEIPGNLFNPDYCDRRHMRFGDFLHQFSQHYSRASADEWLLEKAVFSENEAHGPLQTQGG